MGSPMSTLVNIANSRAAYSMYFPRTKQSVMSNFRCAACAAHRSGALRLALLVACGTAQAFLLGGERGSGLPVASSGLVSAASLDVDARGSLVLQARCAALLPSRERRRPEAAAAFRPRLHPSPAMSRRSDWDRGRTPGPSCARFCSFLTHRLRPRVCRYFRQRSRTFCSKRASTPPPSSSSARL